MTRLAAAIARFVGVTQPHATPERSLVGAGLAQLVVAGAAAALSVLSQLLIARWIGVDEFGYYAYALSWINVAALVAALGFDTASLRFVAAYRSLSMWDRLRGYMRRSMTISVAVAAGAAVTFVVLRWNAAAATPGLRQLMIGAALLLPLLTALRVSGSHLQALRRPLLSASTQSLARPALLLVVLFCVATATSQRLNAAFVIFVNAGATALAVIACSVATHAVISPTSHAAGRAFATREWVATASPLLAIGVSQALLLYADTLILGAYRGAREAGLYAVAAQLVTVITLGINSANAIVAPRMAELHAQRNLDEMRRLLKVSARSVLAYATPVLIALAVFGPFVLRLYGEDFVASWRPMMILAAGQLSVVVFGSVGFLLTMSGNERIASAVIVACAALNVVLNLLFIPRWGAEGAATATAISTFARSAVLTIVARRTLGIAATAF